MASLVWNVLQVDDSPEYLYLFQHAIESTHLPVCVHAVPSALAALNFLAKQGRDRGMPTPDLIVSDLNMPMISGLEFLQLLKQSEWSHIPVLIQTTSSSPAERSTAMGLGAVDFWTKEPLWDDFVKQLTKLVTYLSQDGVEGRAGSEGA
jgi:CheY-like chemotaxis protein